MAVRRRLDAEMVRRKLVDSRAQARAEIEASRVLVDGSVAAKAARLVDPAQDVRLLGPPPRYVSRAGLKLEAALERFAIDPSGLRCLDAGSSTGGFTDCLLQNDAASVIAVDVGTNQLHERVRADRRVSVHEQTDIRTVGDRLGNLVSLPLDLVVADLSFISLRLVLPALAHLAGPNPLVSLVKPQFEAGRAEASRGRGVIKDPAIWRRVLDEVVVAAGHAGMAAKAAMVSPISGAAGNVEFVVRFQAESAAGASSLVGVDAADAVQEANELVAGVVAEAEARAV